MYRQNAMDCMFWLLLFFFEISNPFVYETFDNDLGIKNDFTKIFEENLVVER